MNYRMLAATVMFSLSNVVGKPPALINFGNSCYMNATAQILLNLTQFNDNVLQMGKFNQLSKLFIPYYYYNFVEAIHQVKQAAIVPQETKLLFNAVDFAFAAKDAQQILEDFVKNPTSTPQETLRQNFSQINSKLEGYDFLKQFVDAIVKLEKAPSIDEIGEIYRNLMIGYAPKKCQQDAGEALSKILNLFESAMDVNSFEKLFKTTLNEYWADKKDIYNIAKYSLIRPTNFVMLPLTLEAADNLIMLLDSNYFSEIVIENRPKVQIKRAVHLPEYLILELTRRSSNNVFDNKLIDVPLTFEIPEPWTESWRKPAITPPSYELIGVIRHSGGSALGGHYTAYIKDQHDEQRRWYYCDDASIREIGIELSSIDKTNIEKYGTVLVYQKIVHVQGDTKVISSMLQTLYQELQSLLWH